MYILNILENIVQMASGTVLHFYQTPGLSSSRENRLLDKIKVSIPNIHVSLATELCYNIGLCDGIEKLSEDEEDQLLWVFNQSFQHINVSKQSWLDVDSSSEFLVEIGPRLNFSTAFSTNAVAIFQSVGLEKICRIEISRRYKFNATMSEVEKKIVTNLLHDRMTECQYKNPLASFAVQVQPEEVYEIDILGHGRKALEKANSDMGLAFDDWDIDYYTSMFAERVCRNPTNVECFDLAQSNSEHSRHWFFKGRMVVDGTEKEKCLMNLVVDTQQYSNDNNVIKFSDNSR